VQRGRGLKQHAGREGRQAGARGHRKGVQGRRPQLGGGRTATAAAAATVAAAATAATAQGSAACHKKTAARCKRALLARSGAGLPRIRSRGPRSRLGPAGLSPRQLAATSSTSPGMPSKSLKDSLQGRARPSSTPELGSGPRLGAANRDDAQKAAWRAAGGGAGPEAAKSFGNEG